MATPKIIPYQVKLRSTTIERSLVRPIVYTNDLRSAEFQFQVTDMQAGELSGATATTLLYMRDGSFFQNPKEDVELTGTTFSYLLKEDEGNHAGIARIQLVVRFNEGLEDEQNFPSQLYDFEIVNGLETQVAQQIMIHDWTTLTREARAYIDEFAANEILREAEFDNNEFDRNAAFNLAQTNRQNQFSDLAEDLTATLAAADANIEEFDVALETGIAAAKLAEKLEDFEEINNSRLLSTERQLAHKATTTELAVEKARIDSFTTLVSGSTTGDAELIDVRISTDGTVYKNAGGSIRGQISQLVKIPENKWTYGNKEKVYTTGQTWVYQDFELFGLSKGKAYKIQISGVENHPNADGLGRFICLDASNNEIVAVSVFSVGTWYELPISENTAKVVFRIQTLKGVPASVNGTAKYNGIIVRDASEKITLDGDIYIPQLDVDSETHISFLKKDVEVLNNGEAILLEDNNVLKNKILIFKSRLSSGSFNAVMLGHGKQGFGANYAIVDSSTIKIYGYTTSSVLLNTFNHGLNIENFISIIIAVGHSGKASIKLISSSGMYSSDEFSWSGCNGSIFAESVNSVLTNCQLTWDCQDYKKPIYAFGDSYFSMGYEARWPYYINQFGYDNWFVDSFAGRKSTEGYRSLLLSLEHGTPKHILWCLGMNDADTATEINVDWKNTITALINLCDSKGIELILATIPNVPTRNNSFKNAWVKNSDYRYVDFNKAVGGDLNPNWYAGMLSGDGVHPEILGAQALVSQALIDFPELCH